MAEPAGAALPVAARFAADGEVAGSSPAGVIACGVVWADGNFSESADRATADASGAAVSFFHQAQRGPDWHPTLAASATIVSTRTVVSFMLATRIA